jgi:hypothetical protein
LRQHIANFSELRNPSSHHREETMNDVQKKLAEAAVIWLEKIIIAFITPQEADVELEDE